MNKIFYLLFIFLSFNKSMCLDIPLSNHDILYCPWRSSYEVKKDEKITNESISKCHFCKITNLIKTSSLNANFVLKVTKYHFVVLNTYPYSIGHLLIIPFDHIKRINDLNNESRLELIFLISLCEKILFENIKCDGLNIGINLGSAAGASIPNHLHIHLVPRTNSDLGFINIIGNCNSISANLQETYSKLKPIFDKLTI